MLIPRKDKHRFSPYEWKQQEAQKHKKDAAAERAKQDQHEALLQNFLSKSATNPNDHDAEFRNAVRIVLQRQLDYKAQQQKARGAKDIVITDDEDDGPRVARGSDWRPGSRQQKPPATDARRHMLQRRLKSLKEDKASEAQAKKGGKPSKKRRHS